MRILVAVIIAGLGIVIYQQSHKLTQQSIVIENYRERLQIGARIISENTESMGWQAAELSHELSKTKYYPFFKTIEFLQHNIQSWLNENPGIQENDAQQSTRINPDYMGLSQVLESSRDSFVSLMAISGQSVGLTIEEVSRRKEWLYSLTDTLITTVTQVNEMGADRYNQLLFDLLELEYELSFSLISIFTGGRLHFDNYYPVVHFGEEVDGQMSLSTYLMNWEVIPMDLELLHSNLMVASDSTSGGYLNWQVNGETFDPQNIVARFQAIHPYTADSIEIGTKDGYLLFVRPSG